jgi:predicted HTH domain antitoxin
VKIEVDIPIPEESVDESARERLRRDALEAAVLRLFDERHISSVEAASDLGLTRIQFMELARKRDIPQYDYTAGDLAEDLSDLEKLQKHIPPSAFPQ